MLKIVLPDNELSACEKGISLLEISKKYRDFYASPIAEGVFNGEAANLHRRLYHDGTVDFVEINSEEGMRTYVRTLLFLFIVSARKHYPQWHIEVRNSLGSALFCVVHNGTPNEEALKKIQDTMTDYINHGEKIGFTYVPRKTAELYLRKTGNMTEDRLGLLQMVPEIQSIPINVLEAVPEFFMGPLLTDTSYLRAFELISFKGGVVINYPDTGDYKVLPPWDKNRRINDIYDESEEWAAMIGCNTVSKLNKLIHEDRAGKIIRVAEALHEKKIASIADEITKNKEDLRFVLIAGPSSSGKTSFAQRLGVQLEVNGLDAIPISMDNYYLNRVDTPKKEDGSYDFECVEAIDLELFNKHLNALLNGETIEMPKYDFHKGVREYRGDKVTMEKNSIFLIEGIHALNRKLTASVPKKNKLKIFISALTPMSLDDYNRIPTTYMRLARRIVRDYQFRSNSALTTIKLWPAVRHGEEKYIFPFQEDADIFFNTSLIYEAAALKNSALKLLQSVPAEEKDAYFIAKRLLGFLQFIEALSDKDLASIPNNSILKEFLGGSVFSDVL